MKEISETNKIALFTQVNHDLSKHYGKQKFYKQEQVKQSCQRQNIDIDWHCWAYCVFLTHGDFDAYHATTGESCDYASMRESMVSALDHSDLDLSHTDTNIGDKSWFDFFDLAQPSPSHVR